MKNFIKNAGLTISPSLPEVKSCSFTNDRMKFPCEEVDDSGLREFTQENFLRNTSLRTLDVARILLTLREPRVYNQAQEYLTATSECL